MINHLIHEITIVAHNDNATWEILQIFFENLQGKNIEIVGGLVENKEVGVLHQYRTQVEFASFTTTELIYIIMLLLRRKKEILQELRRRKMLTTTHIDIFGNILNNINNLCLFVEQQTLLRKITKANSIANIELTAIRGNLPK